MARTDGGGTIYTAPRPRRKKHLNGATTGSGTSGGGSTGGSSTLGGAGGSGGSGGGGGDPYLASQKKAQSKAAQRYLQQARSMSGQIAAIRHSLTTGFQQALNQRLANINLVAKQADDQLMEGYNERIKSLEGAAGDNEKAYGQQTFAALSNRGRERANAMSEVAAQGAGETDLLRAQHMSLRNWGNNAAEGTRTFFDTLRSVNSGISDLNVDTKTARLNTASQANADRDQVWSQYYDQRSESLTQIGNLFGQQGELYGMAQEQVGSKKTRRKRRRAIRQSDAAFMRASKANAQVWDNPGAPKELLDWQGHGQIEGYSGASVLANAASEPTEIARPEGANLRSWA